MKSQCLGAMAKRSNIGRLDAETSVAMGVWFWERGYKVFYSLRVPIALVNSAKALSVITKSPLSHVSPFCPPGVFAAVILLMFGAPWETRAVASVSSSITPRKGRLGCLDLDSLI